MKNHKQITELIKRFSGQANVLTIPRVYLDLLDGDHIAALFLSQAVYWSDRSGRTDGKFYKSYSDWKIETGLTQYQVNRAIEKINSRIPSIVERTVKRAHGAPTVHYFVDVPLLSSSIIKFLDNRETSQSDYQVSSQSDYQVSSQSLTETTQKTTTKTNKRDKSLKRKARKRDERLDNPAVMAYREIARLTAPVAMRDDLVSIEDVDKWRRIVKEWIGKGHNPRNISGMIEVYNQGWRSNGRRKESTFERNARALEQLMEEE